MVGEGWCEAQEPAWSNKQQQEKLLRVAESTPGLIGRLAKNLCIAVGAAIVISISNSNPLWLFLVCVVAVGLMHRWYVHGGLQL